MDSLGVDVQVVSTFIGYYQFPTDAQAIAACREANDEVRQMASDYPDRFAGLGTLPLQNLQAAIDELERSVTQLGLKGAMLNDTIQGQTFDAPDLLPFWQAAEQLGALLFVHQGGPTVVSPRADRYHLPNTVGGGVSNVDIDGNNAWQIKAIGVVISTFETLPTIARVKQLRSSPPSPRASGTSTSPQTRALPLW